MAEKWEQQVMFHLLCIYYILTSKNQNNYIIGNKNTTLLLCVVFFRNPHVLILCIRCSALSPWRCFISLLFILCAQFNLIIYRPMAASWLRHFLVAITKKENFGKKTKQTKCITIRSIVCMRCIYCKLYFARQNEMKQTK